MKITTIDLQYISQLIYETHHLPVTYINSLGDIIFDYSTTNSPSYISLKEQLKTYPYHKDTNDYPIFFSYAEFNFFYINVQLEDQYLGAIVVGPSLSPEVGDIKTNVNQELIPILHYQQCLAISLFVYYSIYQKKLNKTAVIYHNQALRPLIRHEENTALELSYARRNDIVHTNLYYEKILLDNVKNGRMEKLNEVLNYSIVEQAELGILSKRNNLRSVQYLMITGIALICRAAIEGGLNEETAFTLNDFYIQKLEDQNSLIEILSLMEEAIYDYTSRVSQANTMKYSGPITTCIHFIENELYGDLTLDQLSAICHISPNYLSSLFKKEVGTSFSEYIQQQRIDEAKKLLTFTNYPILDIGSLLNFTDQSYFIKVFKKFTGITPKQYRTKYSHK
ncbi:helix-turn-helix transcriptional regulator [Lysinibacillus fusiformis]|uniref:AraC family transcriptional regulator n=1 Tax=Lysinibacillus fusiformis TaxID=28031 RepID=UPI001967230E|nr:AraC family transcriptional regulator [Lysinibacillus fusiformis]QSB08549.1 helix-turn-helix transcriptional regulator [Lysinibacillus fusiformis]